MATAQQIKMVHVLKSALKLSDEDYRLVLSGYGVTTSKKLCIQVADQLIEDLRAKAENCGAWERRNHEKTKRRLGDDPQTGKIQGLWAELHKEGKVQSNSAKALSGYVKRMSGKDALKWCTSYEKGRIIEALKQWLER